MSSPTGVKLINILEVDFSLRAGFRLDLDQLDCREFELLRTLHGERQRYEDDMAEEQRRKNRHG